MKHIIFMSAIFSLGVTGQAMATCAGTALSTAQLKTLLQGNTICVAKPGGWESQEFHQTPSGTANNLIDYKLGPTDPVDPTKAVGMWTIPTIGSTVIYNYGTGGTYTYKVYVNGANYDFCSGATFKTFVATGSKKTGSGACP